ncbi:MAG: hypothetical protein ABI882_23630 [Acidobacteriota bacterium]
MLFNTIFVRHDRRGKLTRVAIPVFLLIVLSSCAAPLYTVAPIPRSPPSERVTATTGALEVTALAFDDERAIERFDANLPLAGLIAVEVRLNNQGSSPIAATSLRISLLDSSGKSLRSIPPKKALSRVMKYYGVRLYGKEGYARTVASYEAIGLNLEGEISPSSERSGILFFEHKAPVTSMAGYRLSIEGGPSSISLQLN